jgi:hypothetical protein
MSLAVVHCRNCGSGCLADVAPDDCNNCNPLVRALFADAIRHAETHLSEEEQIHEFGRVLDPNGWRAS